ncbi:unnamed protein product [Brassica rapa]|uniref:Uncharacterized protein n=2 Tax=Brassica TaxID=3705 RepID=A0A8D9GWJ7_BRACM|nr:unnamed protein product [Brassica napus]CAG7888390.1 unnamed protein product [Brassica rapa]
MYTSFSFRQERSTPSFASSFCPQSVMSCGSIMLGGLSDFQCKNSMPSQGFGVSC